MPVRRRAVLAYDGTAYQGFQRQAGDTPTVQAAVEEAITEATGCRTVVTGAGRTDAGVHAAGQVIAFDLDGTWAHGDEALLRAINAHLPDDIALQSLEICAADFHPRFSALSRVYRYSVHQSPLRQPLTRRYAWHVRGPLDLERMNQAAARLIGQHDFAAFGQPSQGESAVRAVMISQWMRHDTARGEELLVYEIEANAFLYRMVRRIVGTLVEVGRGRLTQVDFEDLFDSRDPSRVKVTAPPQGLSLVKVRYPAHS